MVDPDISNWQGQIIYLDFEGEQNVTYNGPVTVGPFDVPAFSLKGTALAGQEPAIIADIVSELQLTFAGSGIILTTEQPAAGQAHSTIYVGGDDSAFAESSSFLGLAEKVDEDNQDRQDDGFAFSDRLVPGGPDRLVNWLAATVAHEAGHLLGMQHLFADDPAEPMASVAYMQGDFPFSGPVHQYITNEAFDFYTSQFSGSELGEYIGPMPGSGGINDTVLEGSCDEDRGSECPWGNASGHLWGQQSDGTRSWDYSGAGNEDTAVNRAYEYFTGGQALEPGYTLLDGLWETTGDDLQHGIAWMYSNGNQDRAYYWLGHVAHLLEDVTLPAHALAAHALLDKYESYTGRSNNWEQWGFPTAGLRSGPTGDIRLPQDTWDARTLNPLYYLFEDTAEAADDFDSDLADGESDGGTRRANGISDGEARDVGDTMMPRAMKAVAELFRYFYGVVDEVAPVVGWLTTFGSEVSTAVQRTGTFAATVEAQDSGSGYDKDGFRFTVQRYSGGTWQDVYTGDPNAGTDMIAVTEDGLYRVGAAVQDGGGNIGQSDYGYFYVYEASPSASYGMTITSCTISDTTPEAGQAVTLSEMGGQVHGADVSDLMKVVIGFRDSSGNWVGGDPVVVSSTVPGQSFQPWTGSSATINAPSSAGTYHVWVRAVPTVDDATAIADFKSVTATDEHQRNDEWDVDVTVPAVLSPVYRFWSPTFQAHFYTISVAERDHVMATWPTDWAYETIAYYAFAPGQQPAGTTAVYRFWSPTFRGHFYTISVAERDHVIATWPTDWTYEGIAYYAYAGGQPPAETLPVYRFWSPTFRHHFYTISLAERDHVIAMWPTDWTYELMAWYTYPDVP